MKRRLLAAVLAALAVPTLPAAVRAAPPPPAAKRVAPPPVTPLRMGSLRIQAVPWAHDHGLGQNGGVIEAVDAASGERRWLLQVYTTIRDPAMESDVQDVFITRLARAGRNRIRVEDERGRHWLVDLASRTVTPQR
jgi:hypothetical protein